MRIICLALLALFLLGFNAKVYCCEHAVDTTEITLVQNSHNSHKAIRGSPLEQGIGLCCSGLGMTCCMTVTNTLNISKPVYRVSEEMYLQDDNYKSFVAHTLQRPPCDQVV